MTNWKKDGYESFIYVTAEETEIEKRRKFHFYNFGIESLIQL